MSHNDEIIVAELIVVTIIVSNKQVVIAIHTFIDLCQYTLKHKRMFSLEKEVFDLILQNLYTMLYLPFSL